MKKDFRRWHDKKEIINRIPKLPFFHEREIWFCHLGVNVGFEEDGRGEDFLRPVVVVRKFSSQIFWAVPLTKSVKQINDKTQQYYFQFSYYREGSKVQTVAILSQIRLIDARRLHYVVGTIEESDFSSLKQKLKALLP